MGTPDFASQLGHLGEVLDELNERDDVAIDVGDIDIEMHGEKWTTATINVSAIHTEREDGDD